MYNTLCLPNGLKIIQCTAQTDNVYCGLIVQAGTAHEDEPDLGLAHFCEHTSFKGTQKRKAHIIRNFLNGCGGDINAYTSKEETCYYTAVPAQELPRAIDILCDIVFGSIYPQRELDKEKKVIADEIDSYLDSPAELIYDEFERMIFSGHPLGRDILGTAERLEQYTTDDALRFARKYYRPANCTFYILGNIDFARAVQLLEKATATLPPSCAAAQLPPIGTQKESKQVVTRKHDTHQSHVLIGNRSYPRGHKHRHALILLNSILGGSSMNSLLGVQLRERRGLVYTVYSSVYTYAPAGIWTIYYGCDERNVNRCRDIILRTLDHLCNEPVSQARLRAAKKMVCGQISLGCDHLVNYSMTMGKLYAYANICYNVQDTLARIQAVTAEQMQRVARDIFAPNLQTTLIYN